MKLLQTKAFYKRVLVITLPIVIQNLLDAAVNTADVMMMNAVSQQAMSAVSLASNATSVIFMLLYGLGTAMTMLGSQYWGKGDIGAMEKVQGIAIRYTFIIGGVIMAVCLAFPEMLMKIFTSDSQLIPMGAEYLRIFSFGLIFWTLSSIYLATLRSTGRTAICTWVEAAALLMNVALNALFIFVFRMEVAGVAIATVISRVLEFILCLILSVRSKTVKLRFRPMLEHHRALEKDFVRMCLPAIGNDLAWGVAFSLYSAILGHLSSDAVAANAIVGSVRSLGCVLCYAIASASGIIVGQLLGAGKQKEAISAGSSLLRITVVTGAVGGGLVALCIPVLTPLVNLTDSARELLRFMLTVNVFYIMGTAVNSLLIAGLFRAGGDTRFGFLCDTIDMWGYALPVGFIAAFILKWDVKVVYLLLCTDEFVKWPWVLKHYFGKTWANNITRDETP